MSVHRSGVVFVSHPRIVTSGRPYHVVAGVGAAQSGRTTRIRADGELGGLALRPPVGRRLPGLAGARPRQLERVEIKPGASYHAVGVTN